MKEVLIHTGEVLKEFQDVMPKELPNKLPPRREVDLEIELESSSKPPSGAPYRMAPPKLEELGKKTQRTPRHWLLMLPRYYTNERNMDCYKCASIIGHYKR